MVTRLEDARAERIRQNVEPVHLGRLFATVLLGVFYILGWLAAWVAVGIAWAWAATKTGWRDVYTEGRVRGRGA